MAKHAVPKRKQSKARSQRRYHTFETLAQKRLLNGINLVACGSCGQMRKVHHACPACGMYRGRQVVNMEKAVKKITTIQA